MASLTNKGGHVKSEKLQELASVQADHEMFLQAFEKPTQIYKFLKSRNFIAPIFLQRNLLYMKNSNKKTQSKRKPLKLDGILEDVLSKREDKSNLCTNQGYLNIKFTGFYHEEAMFLSNTVSAEIILLKICNKKRKDVSCPVVQVPLGSVQVEVNPVEGVFLNSENSSVLSISKDNFTHNNGHVVKSYVLLLKVPNVQNRIAECSAVNGDSEAMCLSDIESIDDEPPKKRLKEIGNKNGDFSMPGGGGIYGAELVVFDRHQHCLLTSGDYELVLQYIGAKPSISDALIATWETFMDGKAIGPLEVFNDNPTMKFTVKWSEMPYENCPAYTANCLGNGYTSPWERFLFNSNQTDWLSSGSKHTDYPHSDDHAPAAFKLGAKKKTERIFYKFLYSNNCCQQTEARENLQCPWCSLNCQTLYGLLKHHKLCHSRFNFTYTPHAKGAQIEVSINEGYDGSYDGNPQDLHSYPGFAFSRNGPCRRTPVTQILVYRPERPKFDISEFLELEEKEIDLNNRTITTGHNRLYYHTHSCMPIRPQEIPNDSEDEIDPEWLRMKTHMMIEEFTDVNEGEKEFMKVWNHHTMKHNYISDGQIPQSCLTFVNEHKRNLMEKNLYYNFLFHLVNFYDCNLIDQNHLIETMELLDRLNAKQN